MKNYKKILCIGGHSLDAEIMGGPIVIKAKKKGADCVFAHVTQGRVEKENATEIEKEEYQKKLVLQNENAAKILGGNVKRFKLVSSNMPSEEEFYRELKKYIKEEGFDLIVTHYSGTFHPRHLYTYNCVTKAIMELNSKGFNIDVLYGENCEDLVGFIPQLYIGLDEEEVKCWFNALKQYDVFNGLLNNIPYYHYYSSMGIIRGMESGMDVFTKAYMYGPKLIK